MVDAEKGVEKGAVLHIDTSKSHPFGFGIRARKHLLERSQPGIAGFVFGGRACRAADRRRFFLRRRFPI